jgi:uncharacterized protein
MEARLAALLVRFRVSLFWLALALTAALAYGSTALWFESSYKIFFDKADPQLLAHEAMEEAYTKADNVAFVVAPQDGRIFTRETLTAIEELTSASWQLPRSVRVDSITNFQYSRAEGDELIVTDLVRNAPALSDAELAQLQAIALAEPALVNMLISSRAHVSNINVRLEMPGDSRETTAVNQEVMSAARALVAEFESRYPNLKLHLIGQVVVNHAFNESAEYDAGRLVPAMFIAVLLLITAFLRSVTATVVTTFVILTGILITVGFTGWLGFQLNQVNISAPIIILTLAVSDCVHILVHYLRDLRKGMDKPAAMEHALRINLVPVFLTSITTAIGFFSLNTSDSPPFRELGTVVGFGVIGVMVLTLCLLPTLMMALPLRIRPRPENPGLSLKGLADVILRYQRLAFWGSIGAALLCFAFIGRNDLNDDTVEYFHEEMPIRQAFDFVQANLTGVDSIAYSLDAGGPEGVYDPSYLHKVESFANWLRTQPEVSYVASFTDVIKRLNRNMNGDDPAYYRIPEDRELAAQYVLLYELSLPPGLDLANQVTFDKSATKLTVQVQNVKAKEIIAIEDRAQAWLAANAPELRTHGTGLSLMFAHIGQNNIKSMMRGSVIALLLISLTLIITLRSVKFGLLSLLPNAFPAAMAFGIWGMTVARVNLAVAAVFSITLGIVVDNTIHFFSKYLHARRELKLSTEDAIRYAFSTVGSALLVTTSALVIGFFILAQSNFDVNSSMGLMTAMTILLALVFDLLFLPGLLLRFDRSRRTQQE